MILIENETVYKSPPSSKSSNSASTERLARRFNTGIALSLSTWGRSYESCTYLILLILSLFYSDFFVLKKNKYTLNKFKTNYPLYINHTEGEPRTAIQLAIKSITYNTQKYFSEASRTRQTMPQKIRKARQKDAEEREKEASRLEGLAERRRREIRK